MSNPFKEGAGGRSGGLGMFFIGLLMTLAGGYMFLTSVRVSTTFWSRGMFGTAVSPFGATMVIFIIGVILVFYDADKKIGWIIAGLSLVVMLIGIIVNLQVYLFNTTLFVTLIMFVLLFGGIGLMARAVRAVD